LNAQIGVVIAEARKNPDLESIHEFLEPIQHQLFVLGSHLATPYSPPNAPETLPPFPYDFVEELEQIIDLLDESLPKLTTFILPGGHPAAAQLHVARTVCRRAERAVVALSKNEEILETILQYLNRLSDLLFTAARAANQTTSHPDVPWKSQA
ncbi:MAG: ATP:cob(I)alamin adenosyltransferase, partial [Candidatus Kerfeldbacteria bacterium CG_4_9_14_3_um_filter_45_8]